MVLSRWLTGRSGVESSDAVTEELKTAVARALADPTRENILASLDAEHKATPLVAVDVLRNLPTDQQLRYRELVGAFSRAEARGVKRARGWPIWRPGCARRATAQPA